MQLAGRAISDATALKDAIHHAGRANFYLVWRKNYMPFVSDALQELIGLLKLLQETC
jgi:hypothetical protein